jgi:uncharacterized phiE125 gp8 family phage protein
MIEMIHPPKQAAVALTELKQYMRISHDLADGTLQTTLEAAQDYIEKQLGLKLITQRLKMICAGWRLTKARALHKGHGVKAQVTLPINPVQELHNITRVLPTGERQAVPNCEHRIQYTGAYASVTVPLMGVETLEVEATVGFGESSRLVPAPIRMAILMMAQSSFQSGHMQESLGLKTLLKPYLKQGV